MSGTENKKQETARDPFFWIGAVSCLHTEQKGLL